MTPEEIARLVQTQKDFFSTGRTRSYAFRKNTLQQLYQAVATHEAELISALHTDLKKPPFEAYMGDVYVTLSEIAHTLKNLKKWMRPTRVKTSWQMWPASSMIMPEPFGTTLIVAPWNYPVQLTLVPLAASIAAGNCAIVKPSEHMPTTGALIKKIISDLFDPVHIAVVLGDATVAQTLMVQPFDYMLITGSTDVGRHALHAAAEHVTPLTLELGGKSPCIVDETANVDLAAKKIVWGKFYNAGQNCVAPDYVLAHASIKNEFIQQIKKYITQMYGDDPQKSPDYARIKDGAHVDRISALLPFGTPVVGGTVDRADNYIAPTVLDNVVLDSPLMKEEIFGPLLPVISFEKLNQAIAIIRSLPKPISSYIFSTYTKNQQQFLHQVSSGNACINDVLVQAATQHLPFGGVGLSGFGRYHGKAGFDTFSNMKSVMKRSSRIDLPFLYPPYRALHTWIKKLLHIF